MPNEPLNPNLPYWTNGGGLVLVFLLILLIAYMSVIALDIFNGK